MNSISLKKILIVFLAIFQMSRTRKIIDIVSEIDTDGILTFEPLRWACVELRFLITAALLALGFVVIWSVLMKGK